MTNAPPPESEQRISTVVGDRLCIKCSFNLSGQPVVRETVYGMAMIRCPECSTVASLQEYPLLGRWAGRIAAMLAALWLLTLIALIFGSAGIMFGLSQATVDRGSQRLATHISVKHRDWFESASDKEKSAFQQMWGGQVAQVGPHTWIDSTWWAKQDRNAILAELGGVRGSIDWSISGPHFWLAFIAAALGTVWSVFLLNLRRWKLLIFALIPTTLAVVFALMANTSIRMTRGWGGGAVYTIQEASSMLWPWLIGIGLGTAFIAFCVGLLIGRPFVRWLTRLLLPPRMLGSIAILWIAEGKRPPRPTR